MSPNGPPRILLCAGDPAALADLRRPLAAAGHSVSEHALVAGEPADLAAYQLIIVDGQDTQAALAACRRFRDRLDEAVVPILFVTACHDPQTRLASFAAGADTYLLRPFAEEELAAQVRAFLRIKDVHDRLAEKTAEVHRINKRLQAAYQQIDQELELAQRIQSGLLPQTLPEVPRGRFAVHYLLCGRVGGDFYDVFRLDEQHVGFYVADAMGHGVPASLLTIFVKKGIRAKEVFGKQYRLVPPDEVLSRLNRDLIDQNLSENPFITMVYALWNHHTGVLQFARAGHPYPLYVPHDGEPWFWKVEGFLLGITDAQFPPQTHTLRPGDKVLLFTDGIDTARFGEADPGAASLRACATRHRALPAGEFVEALARDLLAGGTLPDDLTLLVLEMRD